MTTLTWYAVAALAAAYALFVYVVWRQARVKLPRSHSNDETK